MRLIALTVLFTLTLSPARGEPTTATAPTQTVEAERTVAIAWGGLPPDSAQRVMLRAQSAEEIARVTAKVLGMAPNGQACAVQPWGGSGGVNFSVSLESAPPGTPLRAKEIADAMVERLRELLRAEAHGTLERQLAAQVQVRDSATARLEQSERELDALRKRLREATDRVDVTPADVRKELSSLEEQRQAATLALEQKQVRADALAESVAKLTAEAETRAKDDPVAAELEKVVQIKEAAVARKRALHQQGALSDAELADAEGEVPTARAQLLERRQTVAASIAGDTLGGWNRELLSLGIERAELGSRVKLLSNRLERLAAVANDLDRYDDLVRERDRAREELEHAQHDARAIEQRISTMVMPEAFVQRASDQAPAPPSPPQQP